MRSLSVYLSADMSVLFGDGEGNAVGIYEVDDGIMIIEKFIHCNKEAFDSLVISSLAKYLSEKKDCYFSPVRYNVGEKNSLKNFQSQVL